jgi:hypothetical protein
MVILKTTYTLSLLSAGSKAVHHCMNSNPPLPPLSITWDSSGEAEKKCVVNCWAGQSKVGYEHALKKC